MSRTWRRPALQALAVVMVFAGAGAIAGWAWWQLWSPAPDGVVVEGRWDGVVEGRWFPQPLTEGNAAVFAGTGWYVVAGVLGGLVLGLLAGALLRHHELVTLAAVVAGSVLAAWIAYRVGTSLAPPDPQPLARTAAEGTELPGTLTIAGRSPYLAFPVGALTGLAVTFFGLRPRREDADGTGADVAEAGLVGNHRG